MKNFKDTFDHCQPVKSNISKQKKVDKPYWFLKPNIPLLTQNSINGKSLNWTPTGYATHLPSGDKLLEVQNIILEKNKLPPET